MADQPAVLGFRVKSGWAVAILVGGTSKAPAVLDRTIVELSDPGVPGTKQPHHEDFGTAQTDASKIRRLTTIIERCAARSIAALVGRHQDTGHHVREAAVVVGSLTDPASITNQHIRAHALEAQLFRRVLEDALRSSGVPSVVFVERDLQTQASERLRRPIAELRPALAAIGRGVKPWRSEDKAAALAAWVLLGAWRR